MPEADWSDLWSGVDRVDFNIENPPYTWSFYDIMLNGYDFKGKRVLEFGCGTGVNSLVMAAKGAKLLFYDSSKRALELVKKNLDALSIDAELAQGDIFDADFNAEFDLVHSEGLVEHFLEPRRQEIVDIHARAVKKRGDLLLLVPHRKCPAYRIGKYIATKTGAWVYGDEYPYTKNELIERMSRSGVKPGRVVGGETIFSIFFLLSPLVLRSRRLIRTGITRSASNNWKRLNYDNWLANRYGRVIGAVGKKL